MGFYVLVQPEEQSSAMAVEHSIGHPSLIVESGGSTITFQIAGSSDGALFAARLAREIAASATTFAFRCDELARVDIANLRSSAALAYGQGEAGPTRHALDEDQGDAQRWTQ